MKISILLATLVSFSTALGAAPTKDSLKLLKDTLSRIQKAKMSQFKLEKKVLSDLMGTEKTFQGEAYLAGSLLRFETQAPDKSLVVFDGKTLWVVQYPDPSLGGPVQVVRGSLQGKQKDQMLLTELLAKGHLVDSFDITKTGEENGESRYEALPKKGKKLEVKKVTLAVKNKELKLLEYADDVGNKTSLKVNEQQILKKARTELFVYKPEKGAQVTDL